MSTWIAKDDLQTVTLTPTHYFDEPDRCHVYQEGRWIRNRSDFPVLHPEVYWWLREHVGFALNEDRGRRRIHYPDEKLPEMKEETPVERLCNNALRKIAGEYDHCRLSPGSIYFPKPRHAAAFRARFGLWNRSWEKLHRMTLVNTRYSSSRLLPEAIRRLSSDITAVAYHDGMIIADNELPSFVTHSPRRYYLITDEDVDHQRIMFMLANQSPNPQFIVAGEA